MSPYPLLTKLVLPLVVILFLGSACKSTHPLLEREWMEVRNSYPEGKSVFPPDSYFHFKKRGKFIADIYTALGYRTKGTYIVKDSLLTIDSEEGRRLWNISTSTNFIIQQLDKDYLVLLAHIPYTGGIFQKETRTFIPIDQFKSYTAQELKEKYSFTHQDSLNEIENRRKYEADKALRANDRYSPIYKGGNKAVKAFIKDNLVYPPDHDKRVMVGVEFVVNKEGKVTELKTRGRIPEYYDTEAKRVVQSMPDWEPAIIKGQPEPGPSKLLIIFDEKKKEE